MFFKNGQSWEKSWKVLNHNEGDDDIIKMANVHHNLSSFSATNSPNLSQWLLQFLKRSVENVDDGFYEPFEISTGLKVFFYSLYILIFFVGLFGNSLVCYVVFRDKSMHSVTNFFITNLALSDILLCTFAVPFTPLYLLTFKAWLFGALFCHLVPFAQG